MRRLLPALLIAFAVALLPVAGQAQTQPQSPGATAPTAGTSAPAVVHEDDTLHTLAVGLGAITGMVLASVLSTNVVHTPALANLGQGVVVFAGTVIGGLAGNWFMNRNMAVAKR